MGLGASFLGAAGVILGVSAYAHDAHALGPVGVEVGAKVGGGTNLFGSSQEHGAYDFNPMGFGVGARGGVTVSAFYVGLSAVYYVGSTSPSLEGSLSSHSLLYGLEAGYGFKLLGRLTIRPQLGIGNFDLSDTFAGGNFLYLEPGVVAFVELGWLYAGADANALVLPAAPDMSGGPGNVVDIGFTAHGQVGVRF
jgi:hypothetical protein